MEKSPSHSWEFSRPESEVGSRSPRGLESASPQIIYHIVSMCVAESWGQYETHGKT
jgi:hypothetical protein